MNINDVDLKLFDELASDYLTGMYESQYDDDKKGKCCICNKETELYCESCSITFGEFDPTWYCEEHYKKTVMTGNCCRQNELNFQH